MKNEITEFIQDFLNSVHIQSHILSFPAENCGWLDLGLRKQIIQTADPSVLYNRLFASLKPEKVYHLTDMFQCTYTTLQLPDSRKWLFCGPILFEKMDSGRLAALLDDLKLPASFSDSLQEYYYQVPLWSMQSWYENLFTLFANRLYGENKYEIIYKSVKELDAWGELHGHYLKNPESNSFAVQNLELCHEIENNILAAAANGNEAKALSYLNRLHSLALPTQLPNELRTQKNFCISLNALLRKTAERSKVHIAHSNAISLHNVQLIEQLTSREDCRIFQRRMIQEYCQLIRKNNLKDHTPFVRKIITSVDNDLQADLSLNAFAKQLSVNASYLSSLFKKEMGIPLSGYVNGRRMEHARRLLLCTDLPIKSVAQQCGIPDIYYFNHLFKRITGMTPKAYRETVTYDEFLQSQLEQ